MDPSTEEWLGKLGLSQHNALLEAAGLMDAAGFGIAPQCLNDLLKEAGLPLPARAKILANAHPPDEDGIRMVSAVDATTTHYWPVGVAVGLVLVLVPCCVLYYFHRQHTSRLTPHASQPVRKSTSATGAPDNSSLSHFSAMTRPSWLCR